MFPIRTCSHHKFPCHSPRNEISILWKNGRDDNHHIETRFSFSFVHCCFVLLVPFLNTLSKAFLGTGNRHFFDDQCLKVTERKPARSEEHTPELQSLRQ